MSPVSSKEDTITQALEARFCEAFLALVKPQPGQRLVVAFSGGADSTALLTLLRAVSGALGIELITAHLDHGLRGSESQRDRKAAESMAQELDAPFIWAKADCQALARAESLSVEEAARKARYRFLERVRHERNADYIATGHTADDNAEVLLLNLMRGAGPQGLAGIPPVRQGHILRPLLTFWKEELLDYLKAKGLSWVEDSSNRSLSFTRNRVRHDLLPRMAQDYNPAVKAALVRTARLIQAEESAWEEILAGLKPGVGWEKGEEAIRLLAGQLTGLNRALGRRLVREGVRCLTGQTQALTMAHVEDVLELASSGTDRGLDLPAGLRAWVQGEYLFLGTPPREADVSFEYPLVLPGLVHLKELGLELRADISNEFQHSEPRNLGPFQAVMDLNRLALPLLVRNQRPGDRFQPLGMKGRKKLHDFFIDAKVPARLRPRTPLVLDQEGIVWVGGLRIAERVRAGTETRQAVVLTLKKAALT